MFKFFKRKTPKSNLDIFDIEPPKYEDLPLSGPEHFEISYEPELQKYQQWRKDHHKCIYRYAGAIGGATTYKFTPTGLGTVIKVYCYWCKTDTDITDYDSW